MTEGPEVFIDDSRKLTEDDAFCFACTAEKECFTACCYDLNLVLMPYDIFRLKKRLGMSSDEFLNKFTSVHVGQGSGFPVVMLKMEGSNQKCPFLEEFKGCTVYEDRPGACRTYPLARMACRSREREGVEEFYYVVREPDCRGFSDTTERTIIQWKDQEGLREYNEMNDVFGELLQAKTEAGVGSLHADQIETFYMGCYNLDEFRRFFLDGPNFDRYMESEEVLTRISEDDEELLKYAMRWVKGKLFQAGCAGCASGKG